MKGICVLLFSIGITVMVFPQKNSDLPYSDHERCEKCIRFVFYNLENLFDARHDSLKADLDFTPEGKNHWTYSHYLHKLTNICKTIVAIGGWDPPELIGVAEIENEAVLRKLVYDTPLSKFRYGYIHYESPDVRGVDVALLYLKDRFKVLKSSPVAIRMVQDTGFKTRDILYVKGIINSFDTLHLFINHWPSSFGGFMDSKPRRDFVAGVLRMKVDSILSADPNANILIAGDFNDECTDESIGLHLNANGDTTWNSSNLIDLMAFIMPDKIGSHKYAGRWRNIDQIIVTQALYKGRSKLKVDRGRAFIFSPDFLLEEDKLGKKPYRTFLGPRYIGGFSDHLPVYTDIICR